ncbi:MAG: hypothetical protein HFF09_05985 [Oscillospiraceae bacterium]|nr:hypothetical protein [Oscillospiraceae bacterium]
MKKQYPMADPQPKKQVYLPELTDTVSSMECTGLMPTLPTDEEFAAYQELSSMAIPKLDALDGRGDTPPRR